MSRAILIPFLRYTPHVGDYYKVFYDFFLKHYDPSVADKVYLIDGDHGFYDLPSNAVVLQPAPDKSHWASVKKALNEIPERYVFLMDQDTVIWQWQKVKEWFEMAEAGYWVTGFDGSGKSLELPINKSVARITPYYTIIDKEWLKLVDNVDFTPKEGHDSFGDFTHRLFSQIKSTYVHDGSLGGVYEIYDDRASLYYEPNHVMGPIVKEPNVGSNYGYYHIRNGNLANYLITTLKSDMDAFHRCVSITPPREALRILAWFEYLSDGKYSDDVGRVAIYFGMEAGKPYMEEFRKYHHV